MIIEATITNLGTIPLVFEEVGFESPTALQFYADFEFVGSSCEPLIACSYRYCRNAAFPPLFPRQSNICNWTFRVKPDALNQSSAVRLKVGTGRRDTRKQRRQSRRDRRPKTTARTNQRALNTGIAFDATGICCDWRLSIAHNIKDRLIKPKTKRDEDLLSQTNRPALAQSERDDKPY